jgi:integrase
MKTINRLSERVIATLMPAATDKKYGDGDGLHIRVLALDPKHPEKVSRYWNLKIRRNGKDSLLGLGSWPAVDCAAAREKAAARRAEVASGQEPIRARAPETEGNTLSAMTATWLERRKKKWIAKYHADVSDALHRYVLIPIGDKPMARITLAEIAYLVGAISDGTEPACYGVAKPILASKLLQHLTRIFGLAEILKRGPPTVLGKAGCETIRKDFLAPRPKEKHRPYMDHEDVPAFWKKLDAWKDCPAKFALQFAILNASRTGEIRGARFDEIDQKGDWTIPDERMKQGIAHVVPLSRQAREIVKKARKLAGDSPYLFPNDWKPMDAGMSGAIMLRLLKKIVPGVTVHGFRQSFSNWANLRRGRNADVIERILAHGNADKIRGAYFTHPMHNDRRKLLQTWADFVTGAA